MIKRAVLLLLLPAVLTASEPLDALGRAQAEAEAAARKQAALELAAGKARGEAAQLRARQQAAAAGIELAEARIAASDLELDRARMLEEAAQAQLTHARAPAAALIAGIVTMARRPPLLVLADGGSIDQLVRTRALLDTGVPVIRARSATLAKEVEESRTRARAVAAAASGLAAERTRLVEARAQFSLLERQAEKRAGALEGDAFLAADRVIAGSENVETLGRAADRDRSARNAAALLARLEPLPPRPGKPDTGAVTAPFAYRLPGPGKVEEGMGAVNDIGVAARGVTLSSPRGAALVVPASGTVLFAGPYRRFDGLVIIDHGGGWTTLITNVRPAVAKGAKVRIGEPLGSALGPVSIELREKNALRSPALIARSSVSLSNGSATR